LISSVACCRCSSQRAPTLSCRTLRTMASCGGDQVVKSDGGERCGSAGTMFPAGTVERVEREQTADEVSKRD
jgi:hypothetical protein